MLLRSICGPTEMYPSEYNWRQAFFLGVFTAMGRSLQVSVRERKSSIT